MPSYPADIEAILDLPPKQRAILYLVEVEGVPYAEAADQLGMTTMAARAMANRARKQARLAMEVARWLTSRASCNNSVREAPLSARRS